METNKESFVLFSRERFKRFLQFELIIWLVIIIVLIFRESAVLPPSALVLLPDLSLATDTRVVIFVPHPDDETIACGGLIQRLNTLNDEVFLVLITDGNFNHQQARRDQEFLQAASRLGISQDHLIFLNFPDARLKSVDELVLEQSFLKVLTTLTPKLVFIPSPFDNNLDHQTAGLILTKILRTYHPITTYQYLVHRLYYPRPLAFKPNFYLTPPLSLIDGSKQWFKLILAPQEELIKKDAVFIYQSQLRLEEPTTRELLLAFIRRNELFFSG